MAAQASTVSTEPLETSPTRDLPPGDFQDFIELITPGYSRLDMCIQCGTCGGSCPSAADMDHSPRRLFALIKAGEVDQVLESNTPWYCVSCYMCMTRCPQEVHITDIMYSLKSLASQRGKAAKFTAADFSSTFIGFVESRGRSFETGLATLYNLKHQPLKAVGLASKGANMLTKGRLNLVPERIEGMEQLHKILERARELEVVA
jgi:heterodisulfide reductase subunit C